MPCLQKFFLADSLISVFKWSFLPRFALSMASRWATGIKKFPIYNWIRSPAEDPIFFFQHFYRGNVLFSLPWVNLRRRLGRRRHLIHPKGEVSSRGWLDRPLGLDGAMVFSPKKMRPDRHFPGLFMVKLDDFFGVCHNSVWKFEIRVFFLQEYAPTGIESQVRFWRKYEEKKTTVLTINDMWWWGC